MTDKSFIDRSLVDEIRFQEIQSHLEGYLDSEVLLQDAVIHVAEIAKNIEIVLV